MTKATWLADVLRAAHLTVVEEPHWQERGRGELGTIQGVLCHHTGGPRTGNAPSLGVVRDGRADLPGPLSNLFLARDGTFHVMAAGRCNHAGAGNWHGVTAGNSHFLGIEAENAGTGDDPWPEAQVAAYEVGVAALLAHLGLDELWAVGHKEYALPKGRKVDPSFDMLHFRDDVRKILTADGIATHQLPPTNPAHDMLQKSSMGPSVAQLQTLLGIPHDGNFGPQTDAAVRKFQAAHGLVADGKVGPKTWAALGVK